MLEKNKKKSDNAAKALEHSTDTPSLTNPTAGDTPPSGNFKDSHIVSSDTTTKTDEGQPKFSTEEEEQDSDDIEEFVVVQPSPLPNNSNFVSDKKVPSEEPADNLRDVGRYKQL